MKARFITFEGGECSGKSTQSKLLVNYLRARGYRVLYLREPGATRIGEKIRRILLDKDNEEITPLSEMLLYMSARAQAISELIKPAIKKGDIVVCDRFLDSTIAYQGFGLGIDLKLIEYLGKLASLDIKPDLTIFLDAPVKKGKVPRKNKDRIEKRSYQYHLRVRSGYLKLARSQPRRIKIIKPDKDKRKTEEEIRRMVIRFL
ncbi:MAG: dTMP kinase [Candidatus Omnitrophica bacterium]|nr:dTMP kinase [Candidatus Omnitrophota bacterium]